MHDFQTNASKDLQMALTLTLHVYSLNMFKVQIAHLHTTLIATRKDYTKATRKELRILNILNFFGVVKTTVGTYSIYILHKKLRIFNILIFCVVYIHSGTQIPLAPLYDHFGTF